MAPKTNQTINLELINFKIDELSRKVQSINDELDSKIVTRETLTSAVAVVGTQVTYLQEKIKFLQNILYTVVTTVGLTILGKVISLVLK